MNLTPDQKKFQRELALKHVRRFREADKGAEFPRSDERISRAVSRTVGASVDQVLKWMREARV